MIKVLLDTDIGTDVDDAVCLAYMLSHPDCDLLGITTVTGEAQKRAMLASILCNAAGKDVPIYPGAEVPISCDQRQKVAQQAAALPRWPHRADFPVGQAVKFMRQTIEAHPGEVVLLTIGPLTNAALLFSAHPEVAALLQGLVLMGGVFGEGLNPEQQVEGNILSDPHAAQIVYATRVPLHRSVGLNVTQKVVMPAEEVRRRFTAPILHPVLDFAEIWFAEFYPSITFHDPLAAATIFNTALCSFQEGTVSVDTATIPGRTAWQPGGPGSPHQVATGVEAAKYFEDFFDSLRS